MAVGAVPASPARRKVVDAWWVQLIVRTILALLAVWALVFANHRYTVFFSQSTFPHTDIWMWLAWLGPTAAAGFLFGLAAWLPFAKVRYLWSRLLLAAVALAPLVQFWWVFLFQLPRQLPRHVPGGWLATHADWLAAWPSQSALAVLAGVAIASGFRASPVIARGMIEQLRAELSSVRADLERHLELDGVPSHGDPRVQSPRAVE